MNLEGNDRTVLKDLCFSDFTGIVKSEVPLVARYTEGLCFQNMELSATGASAGIL